MTEARRVDVGHVGSPESSLGQFLKGVREAAGLTLRDVEERTEGRVKNGYLSQVEGNRIAQSALSRIDLV